MDQNQITLYLAIYGAILSTIAMLWNIKRDSDDRANLKLNVKLSKNWIMSGVNIEQPCVEISNIGKRPITVTEISYKIDKRICTADPKNYQDLPKELGEGQFHSIDLVEKDKTERAKIMYFIVKDARGKKYWSKKYPLKDLS
jgi:hypothetical protein